MSCILIVGATRGLGASLASQYAAAGHTVFGTSRSSIPPLQPSSVTWIPNIDLMSPSCGQTLATSIPASTHISIVIITAGFFGKESFDEPDWEAEVRMYTTSSIAPVFIVHHLVMAGLLAKGAKLILVSSESGSIALRHEKEGGGNYGHHGSKAALNMVGKLLSMDLKEKDIVVAIIHVCCLLLSAAYCGSESR